jgi:hypothetical protein
MIGAFWLAIKAFGIWARIGRGAVAVWAWIDRNPALGALCGAGVALLFCWHVIDVKARTIAQLTADKVQMRTKIDVQSKTIGDQQAAIARQNIAVMQLRNASAAAVAAGNKADDAAVTRSKARDGLAAAITTPPPRPVPADCRTPDSVMAAKGEL